MSGISNNGISNNRMSGRAKTSNTWVQQLVAMEDVKKR